ncbi:TetR/AcrR family transcriptional regulator [Paenibacillus sp. JX-17]|uniref:TetR/AcrR family transcriptional regulator n=1 Tax=Paenibacillus lacisoli TaxID=3064525 RepID=A0ABT9CI02_9BACL|nr:TetR/AcrR family transcriptional regulator [Paenibacillus sp. JX-17]MDO7908198.1 TetR/AcrR family transcriptional regulator [Paenibacillus sp. JX-17]
MKEQQEMDRRIRRTREALKSAFITLILEQGYDPITVQEIAHRADYNRTTFYKHYLGKQELLQEIGDDFMNGMRKAYADPYREFDTFELNQLLPSTTKVFHYVDQNKPLFKALHSMYRDLPNQLCDMFRSYLTGDFRLITEPSDIPINYEIMLSYQISATVGVIMYWAESNFIYSADYMCEQLTALINVKPTQLVFNHSRQD